MVPAMTSLSLPSKASTRARIRTSLTVWLWAAAVPLTAVAADQAMRFFELPLLARLGLALAPLVPGALFLRAQSRALARSDELALRITSEGFAFTFYAMIGLFICVDLLNNAAVLDNFRWNTMRLAVAMFLLMVIGTLLSSRRFR